MRIGVAGIELAAEPQGLLPVLAELRVQAAEQAQSALALAARPSEVIQLRSALTPQRSSGTVTVSKPKGA